MDLVSHSFAGPYLEGIVEPRDERVLECLEDM